MGGTTSTATTRVATKAITDIMVQNIMKCSTSATMTQTFSVSGSYNVVENVKQVQYLKLSSTCAQDAQNMQDLQTQIANKIKELADAQGSGVLSAVGASHSRTNIDIQNEIKNSVNQQTVAEIVNSSNATQELIIRGDHNIVKNFSQEQTADIVFTNAQKVVNKIKSVQDIDNKADSEAKAVTTNPISEMIDSVFKGLTSLGTIWIIFILGIAVIFIFGGGKIFSMMNPMSWMGDLGDTNDDIRENINKNIDTNAVGTNINNNIDNIGQSIDDIINRNKK